jgi:Dyp-type peroxidase family
MTDWLQATDIDVDDPNAFELLNNLQANILKHHGRTYAWHVFLQFVPGKEYEIKRWISENLAGQWRPYITSAYEQLKDVQKRHTKIENEKSDYDGGMITCFLLSSKGYVRLGFNPSAVVGEDNIFTTMQDREQTELEDPNINSWEPSFQVEIHAMLILADDNKRELKTRLKRIKQETLGCIKVISNQKGKILRNDNGRPIEHFGYEDGISQPSFLKTDKKSGPKSKDVQPLRIVLLPDKGTDKKDCYGSFVVFRKLEQNVKEFQKQRKKLSDILFEGTNPKLAGAMAMGRFENGTPVTLYDEEMDGLTDKNDFDYSDDSSDIPKCPYHAHIRITNPRGNSVRIVRRGITYDEFGRTSDLTDEPEHGVGLYFISYQASITNQFERIQKWAAGGPILDRWRGIDPIAGQGIFEIFKQKWPMPTTKGTVIESGDHFMHVVNMLGGEYFFAPSIPFLQKLATL